MKNDEIDVIAQLLLESRTNAYKEWLVNEVIMTANKLDCKDELLVMLFAYKNKTTNPYFLSYP